MSDESILTVWTIFHDPMDHPGKWVLRGFDVLRVPDVGGQITPQQGAFVADSLEGVRAGLPPGVTCLGRQEQDDPKIYESWV
jgi:hypothetical protein